MFIMEKFAGKGKKDLKRAYLGLLMPLLCGADDARFDLDEKVSLEGEPRFPISAMLVLRPF